MTANKKKLSIITPVYNVERYVERCIRSLEDQDIAQDEYEVVVINDGSPDNSRGVVLKLMEEYSNIIFIEQENKGVSMARNAGIDRASGEYLLFVDPDDYVEANSFGRILSSALRVQAQIVFLGFRFLRVDGSVEKEIFNAAESNKVYGGIEAYFASRGDGRTDPDRSWAILYERNFLNTFQLRNIPHIPYLEDGEFIARVLCLAERCIFEGQSFYQRTTRPGSATNSNLFYQERAIHGFIKAAKNLHDFRSQHRLTKRQVIFLNQPIAKFTVLALQACIGVGRFKNFRTVKKKLQQEKLTKLGTTGCVNPYRYFARLYNLSIVLLFLVLIQRAVFNSLKNKLSSSSLGHV